MDSICLFTSFPHACDARYQQQYIFPSRSRPLFHHIATSLSLSLFLSRCRFLTHSPAQAMYLLCIYCYMWNLVRFTLQFCETFTQSVPFFRVLFFLHLRFLLSFCRSLTDVFSVQRRASEKERCSSGNGKFSWKTITKTRYERRFIKKINISGKMTTTTAKKKISSA